MSTPDPETVLANHANAIREANEVMAAAAAELRLVDSILSRRPALDDQTNRFDKIRKAIHVAARADELAAALVVADVALRFHPGGDSRSEADRLSAAAALNHYRRPFA